MHFSYLFFVQKSFLTTKSFLYVEINLTTRGPLYTCLGSILFKVYEIHIISLEDFVFWKLGLMILIPSLPSCNVLSKTGMIAIKSKNISAYFTSKNNRKAYTQMN